MAATYADNVLGLVISGSHRMWANVDGRPLEGYSYPGSVSFVAAGLKVMVEGKISPRVAALFVPDALLHRVITEHWETDPKKIELLWQFHVRDRVVESVISSLIFEAKNQSPSGQLYSESACEFLAHHIVRSYSSLSPPHPLHDVMVA